MKRKGTKNAIVKAFCLILTAAICLTFIQPWHTASALTASLPNIEGIVSGQGSYTILEIVPEEGSGTIGFYVGNGYEPTAGYLNELAAISGKTAREVYASALYTRLNNAGIMGASGTTGFPLTALYSSFYTESAYWDLQGNTSGYAELTLDNFENATLVGTFNESAGGAYLAERTYVLSESMTGDFAQNIQYFVRENKGSDYYYYDPEFSQVAGDATSARGEAIYLIEYDESRQMTSYEYLGILGSADLPGLEILVGDEYANKDYYFVSDTRRAYDSYSEDHPFAAVADGFVTAAGGTFASTKTGDYIFVGTGGDHGFASGGGGGSHTVKYNKVYIKTGYTTSNWFLTNVFNQDPASAFNIIVKSIPASLVTQSDIIYADMIYISSGVSETFAVNAASVYTSSNDLSASAYAALSTVAGELNKAIIVDGCLYDNNPQTNVGRAASAALSNAGLTTVTHGVKDSVYRFASYTTANSSTVSCLANRYMTEELRDSANFSEILEEIRQQNFLRRLDGTVDELEEIVSLATILRHIANFANTTGTNKTRLTILELQPTSHYELTASYVLENWLGGTSSGYTAGDITIVQMATGEFIGTIDDISEEYDLIYIGSCVDGMATSSGSARYNDSSMNGLIYTNIGDTYTGSTGLSGLMNSDYTTTARTTISTGSSSIKTYRLSGNDFTAIKLAELKEYASSGYPIVYADTFAVSTPGTSTSQTYSVTTSVTYNSGTATASTSWDPPQLSGAEVSYQWQRQNGSSGTWSNVGTSASQSVSGNNTYQCIVTVSYGGQTVSSYTTSNISSSSTTGTGSGSFTVTTSPIMYYSSSAINTAYVDVNSNVYKLFTSVKSCGNVMTEDDISRNRESFMDYLNISKPQIKLTSQPTKYIDADHSGTGSATSLTAEDGKYYLRYTFTISNETDATPVSTTYDCKLYVDVNADGRFAANEELGDIQIYENGVLLRENPAGNYQLKAGVTYSIARQVPSGMVGILPWKLEVVKNGAANIHASISDYTRVAAASSSNKKTVNVLQIIGYSAYHKRNGQLKLSSDTQFVSLMNSLDDFNVSLTCLLYNENLTYQTTDANGNTVNKTVRLDTGTEANLLEALQTFDMLMLGFCDCYDGLGTNLSNAITTYISNKDGSVLFSHDTTSMVNMSPSVTNKSSVISGITEWGYNFNTLIRDAVGLDRYGVTSRTETIQAFLKSGYTSVTGNTKAEYISGLMSGTLSTNGTKYSVAYKPSSNLSDVGVTVAQVQGFTNYTLINNSGSSGSNAYDHTNGILVNTNTLRTKKVSQVNEGQITTYPYNINLDTNGLLSVQETHEQYYQINLNDDDIVVWYCLADDPTITNASYAGDMYSIVKNDVVNSYYIYTKGNVTYTGMGHTESMTTDERKLFVNTMIAAYQAQYEDPTVRFVNDTSGTSEVTSKYFMVDDWSADNAIFLSEAVDKTLNFIITDPNLTSETKSITLYFSYTVNGNTDSTRFEVQSLSTVSTGRVYTITLPNEVLNTLLSKNVSYLTVKIDVTETIGSGSGSSQKQCSTEIDLRKIGLFQLR